MGNLRQKYTEEEWNELENKYLYQAKEHYETKQPIYRGCPSQGPCFCSGACREIIGYIDKNKLDKFINENIEKTC